MNVKTNVKVLIYVSYKSLQFSQSINNQQSFNNHKEIHSRLNHRFSIHCYVHVIRLLQYM